MTDPDGLSFAPPTPLCNKLLAVNIERADIGIIGGRKRCLPKHLACILVTYPQFFIGCPTDK